MKKIIITLLITVLIALCGLSLAACYLSKPSTVDDFAGTYELEVYTRTYEKDDGTDAEPTNMIEKDGIKAYLIVGKEGTGYYVYKSGDNAPVVNKIKIAYTYDGDDSDLLTEIRYYSGCSTDGDGYPGKGEEVLGLTFGKKDKRLTYSMPGVFGRKFSQTVKYIKVDKATDLSYAQSKLGVTLKATEFELYGLGLFVNSSYYQDDDPGIYFLVNFKDNGEKADVYYAMKADGEDVVERDLPVSFTYADERTIKIAVGDYVFDRMVYDYVVTRYLTCTLPANGETEAREIGFYLDSRDVETVLNEIKEGYTYYCEQQQAIIEEE